MSADKPAAIFLPGPLHLFWTSGVYHLMGLTQTHAVTLLISDPRYGSDPRFQDLVAAMALDDIVLLPNTGPFKRARTLLRIYRELLGRCAPEVLFTNNVNFVENLYLLNMARRLSPAARVVYFQNGRTTTNLPLDFGYRIASDAEALAKRRGLPYPLAKHIIALKNLAASWLNYLVVPMLLTGRRLRPVVDVYRGLVTPANARQWNAPGNEVLVYMEADAAVYRREGYQNVRVIAHPARECAKAVLDMLGEPSEATDRILILPSYGFTSGLRATMSEREIVEKVSAGWMCAFRELTADHPGWPIWMKLHPAAGTDPIWLQIIERLREAFPDLVIVAPSRSAEFLILASKVIAGDVSSALWWANLVGGKTVISFDYFDYPGGDELSSLDGIDVRTIREQS